MRLESGQEVTVRLCLCDPGAVVPRDHRTGPERDETEPLHAWQERALRVAGLVREGA